MNKEQRSAWRKANPEKHREEQKIYYQRHKRKVKTRIYVHRESIPGYRASERARRRTRISRAGGSFTSEQWYFLKKKYSFRCLCCLKKKSLEPDHVIPVAKGGTSDITNIQPLCGLCNKRKRDKDTDYRPNLHRVTGAETFGSESRMALRKAL
jgi:5-methylcytosine-specific restriction protein A